MNNCISDITIPLNNMSWFVVSVIILGLWKYDRCLLDKLERWAWRNVKSLGWSVFEVYSRYKDKNEMLKDGYHVDTVYLFEHKNDTDSRKFDVLSIFRSEIVKGTITHKKGIDFVDFLKLCTEGSGNFEYLPNMQYELEVNYTFDRKQYKIFYSECENINNKIKFPVYSESEMAKSIVESENSIISAQIIRNETDEGGINIDDIILKIAGPKGNFYDDSEFKVKKSWLKYSGIDDRSKIMIMDINGNNFIFEDNDTYLTLKK